MRKQERIRAYRRAARLVEGATNILCASPELPDGDSVGCATAFRLYLLDQGKNVALWAPDTIPDRPIMRSLPGAEAFLQDFPHDVSFDLIVVFDYGALERVKIPQEVLASTPIIGFDHHPSGSFLAPHGFAVLDASASATTMILYEFFRTIGYPINPDIAWCILVGICTDTMSFQADLTTKESFLLAGELWDRYGASVQKARSLLVPQYSRKTVAVWREILNHHTEIYDDIAIIAVPYLVFCRVFTQPDLEYRDVASIMQYLFRHVTELRMVVLLTEQEDGSWRGALRPCAGHTIDVARIAEELGGGGHESSAGFSSSLSLEEIRSKILGCARTEIP